MNLCTPATIYLVLSAIGIIMIAFQNYGISPNMYCVGNVRCPVQSSMPIFIMKIIYVAFWTFVLNSLCDYGYNQLAWFLLLLPFIFFFIFVFMIGSMIQKRTTSVPSMASSASASASAPSPPFYQQQADAQVAAMTSQMRMQDRNRDRDRDRIHSPGYEQDKWFEPAGNAGNAQYGAGYYSSYSDYDHALDERTQQVYDETHENVKKNVHYK